ncbi:MAG: hypothetical protein ACHP8A_00835 [Terriglobales bacterium]|jgi:hypothetical protein|nr:hypothetical protein [Terriglobales bacterium]
MSQINGDKSRFHRERKQNIQRRIRTRELLEAAGKKIPVATGDKKIKAAPAK